MTTAEQARIDESLADLFTPDWIVQDEVDPGPHPQRSTGDDEVRFADESDWLEDEA